MSETIDFKKTEKEFYQPKKPSIIDIPEMLFIMMDGRGDPNTSQAYQNAVEVLYGLSYGIKMSKMGGNAPAGYFEYAVLPLEGLWWSDGAPYDGVNNKDKNTLCWTAMIRQPAFVTPDVFEAAKVTLAKKKPGLDLAGARLAAFAEGLCAQVMHLGPYDDEPATIQLLDEFVAGAGYKNDLSPRRRHHEIYLQNPRGTAPDKLKTVIRHPVVKE